MPKFAVKKIGIIERYQEFLPVTENTPIISLNEGNTPLILAEALPKELGLKKVCIYYKFEGLNPTGSFKDRGMTMAISKAVEEGSKAVMCASTGNTSASAAAYASRCGLKCYVLIPEGKIAKGKLLQAYRYGAKTIMIKGNFDQALELVKQITKDGRITLVNSINPFRIEGQKTAAFEIVDDLGDAPEYHAIPVGNAGNITAYWKGYQEYQKAGKSTVLPKMLGFQAAGAAPIVLGHPVEKPETIATAIRIGNPASWQGALRAREESGGLIEAVTDEEISWAYRFIAEREG
ncbi:MAG TPA: threonine synthase, partial [bacterium]|nr:threonine synthase [bacterium]